MMDLLLLGHIVGDFYFQTDIIAVRKKKSIKYLTLHCLIYAITLTFAFGIVNGNILVSIFAGISAGTSHFVIDRLKNKVALRHPKHQFTILIIDQIIHLLILAIISHISLNYASLIAKPVITEILGINLYNLVSITTAALICWKPSCILVSSLFKSVWSDKNIDTNSTEELIKAGSIIGILEREIILILGINGHYSAIGFVLAAKSIARYKQLEDKEFAEKYLIGTLFSALISIVCAVVFHTHI